MWAFKKKKRAKKYNRPKKDKHSEHRVAPSSFDTLWNTQEMLHINSSEEAVLAAVVCVAKDMEFIARGGVHLPDKGELRKFIKNCVPHIVRGEYIDSYFVNQEHGKVFWNLRHRGFNADSAMIDEALLEVEPLYDEIARLLGGGRATPEKAQAQPETVAEKTRVTHAMNSQDAALFARFNQLLENFDADAADVLAELHHLPRPGAPHALELVMTVKHPDASDAMQRLAMFAGFKPRESGEYVLYGQNMREMLHALGAVLNQSFAVVAEEHFRHN